ncbi:phosphoribosyltransferase [Saccharopolyspora sp. K220]|uniref:phosphoribosyltransferase n=1 Tax=Saccharopolyspora soli TaxID=2926618 RepID=UPI001F5953A5|nr:phosphoribosyltransferase [Saccharopolyspora soli]MCI2422466.1 phosphoribosyltransferase [Saccharopolyspora soli]
MFIPPTTTTLAEFDTQSGGGVHACRVLRLDVTSTARAARVVHNLDGIGYAVSADRLRDAGVELWRRWTSEHPTRIPHVLLGLDTGGIIPTATVALAADLPYQVAWKLELDLLSPNKHRFTAPHGPNKLVHVYADVADRRVLLVDDQITSGYTLRNLTEVLRDAGAVVLGALCLVEDTSGDGRALLEKNGVPVCALTTL